MPFTPIHLGPGLAFKALGGRYVSFMVFSGTQVLMDIEPLLGILQDKPVLHGVSHTLAGAVAIGMLAGAIGKPVSSTVLRRLNIPHAPLTWAASFAGALLGSFRTSFWTRSCTPTCGRGGRFAPTTRCCTSWASTGCIWHAPWPGCSDWR